MHLDPKHQINCKKNEKIKTATVITIILLKNHKKSVAM